MNIKNKKGFTLIELLAVIVILAILMVVSVPKILDVIENSRKKTFGESADLMAKTAQLKYSTSMLNTPIDNEEYKYENGKLTNDSPNLDFSGDKPFQGKIIINNGKVSLAIISKDKRYCAIKNINEKNSKVYDITTNFTIDKCIIGYTGDNKENILPETPASCFDFDESSGTINGLSNSYSVEKCSTDLVIPSSINNKDVLTFKDGAFNGNNIITSVKFNSDSKVSSIAAYSFANASNLKQVILPPSVTNIKNSAFANTGLTNIDLKNVKIIGSQAFSEIKLTSLTIPKTIESIGLGAFAGYNNDLKELIIENSNNVLNTTGNGTFLKNVQSFMGNTVNVTKLTVKNYDNIDYTFTNIFPYVEKIDFENVNELSGSGMFANILSLKKVILKNVKSLGTAIFYGCTNLKSISLSEGLESIGSVAFSNTSIEEVIIPSTIKKWEDSSFSGNSKLKKVTIKKGVTSIPSNAFLKSDNISSIEIPDTVTSIGQHAFNKNLLQNLKLPKSVENLGVWSFNSDTISKITIASNITDSINFAVCGDACSNNNVKEIILEDGVTEIAFKPPYGILNSVVKITIPKSVTTVKDGSFRKYGTHDFSTICYRGSKSEFNKIIVENGVYGNELWNSATKIYNCTD